MVSRTRLYAESDFRDLGVAQKLSDRDLAIVGGAGRAGLSTLQIEASPLSASSLAILQAFESLPDPLPALRGRSFTNRQQLKLSRGVRHAPSLPQVFVNQR